MAGLLDLMGIPYTGSGPVALGLALNKFRAKQMLRVGGRSVAAGLSPRPARHIPAARACAFRSSSSRRTKTRASASTPRSVCHDWKQLRAAGRRYIHDVYRQDALVEEYPRRAGIQRLRLRRQRAGGAGHFGDRFQRTARGRAPNRELPRQVGRREPDLHGNGAHLSRPRSRAHPAASDPGLRCDAQLPAPSAAGIMRGWICGRTPGARSTCSR